jgi:hypothetical protein
VPFITTSGVELGSMDSLIIESIHKISICYHNEHNGTVESSLTNNKT